MIKAFKRGREVNAYCGHEGCVIAMLPFGEHLVSVDDQNYLKIWLIKKGGRRHILDGINMHSVVTFAKYSIYLCMDKSIEVKRALSSLPPSLLLFFPHSQSSTEMSTLTRIRFSSPVSLIPAHTSTRYCWVVGRESYNCGTFERANSSTRLPAGAPPSSVSTNHLLLM